MKLTNFELKVNVTGTIVLFQALYGLLKKSKAPKFVPVSSDGGCLDGAMVKSAIGGPSYGASKAALNWVTRKIHFENEWLGMYFDNVTRYLKVSPVPPSGIPILSRPGSH